MRIFLVILFTLIPILSSGQNGRLIPNEDAEMFAHVKAGGKLTIKNDGKIKLAATDHFKLESGSIIEILWGSIEIPQ